MKNLSPLINSVMVEFNDDDILVVTNDQEYGDIAWQETDGQLYCADSATGGEWVPYKPHPADSFPASGDAAMSLENDIGKVVKATFDCLRSQGLVK
jgi:hypothetical protein